MARKEMFFASGAWGVGNVGDDAIAIGMRRWLGEKLVLMSEHPNKGIRATMTLEDTLNIVCPGDTFLLGGGGTITDDAVMHAHFLPTARKAKEAGCMLRVSRMGLEGATGVSANLLKDLFGMCDQITVRSRWSENFVRDHGFYCELWPDYALYIPGSGHQEPSYDLLVPKMEADGDEGCQIALERARTYATRGERLLIASHVPFHKANPVMGEADRLKEIIERVDSPLVTGVELTTVGQALYIYARAKTVITGRLHGAFFAHICGVPWGRWDAPSNKVETAYLGE